MDIAGLTNLLAPFLPYLLQAGDAFGDKAAENVGTEAWAQAKAIWNKLRDRIAAKPAAEEAARDVADNPDDRRARGALELQLEKLLREDPELERDLARLVGGIRVTAYGERSVASQTITRSTVVTGDHNTLG